MTPCHDLLELLSAYRDDEVSDAERALAAEHLRDCAACRAEHERMLCLDRKLADHFRRADLGNADRTSLHRRIQPIRVAPRGLRWQRVALVLLAASLLLTTISLLLRGMPPPIGEARGLRVLRAGEMITAELAGASRLACFGPGAVAIREVPDGEPGASTEIALLAGSLEVEHLADAQPLSIRLPDGVLVVDFGSARLRVPLPDDRRDATRILLLHGQARFVGADDAFSLVAGIETEPTARFADRSQPPTPGREELPATAAADERVVTLRDDRGVPLGNATATVRWRRPGGLGFQQAIVTGDGQGQVRLPRFSGQDARLDVAATATTIARRVPLKQLASGGELLLNAGGTLSGRVEDVDGRPILGATLTVHSDDGLDGVPFFDGGQRSTMSDAAGNFVLEHVGPVFTITASMAGHAPLRALRGILRNRETRGHLVLRLLPAAQVHGLVTDEIGAPVAQALVRVTREPGPPRYPMDLEEIVPDMPACYTDATGRFTLEQVPALVELSSWASARQHLRSGFIALRLEAGETRSLEFVAPRAFAITGRVVTWAGRAVERALVQVLGREDGQVRRASLPTLTLLDGAFRVDGLGAGETLLVVKADGWSPALLEVRLAGEPHDETVTLALEPEVVLEGQVLGGQSEPVADVTVSFEPLRPEAHAWLSPTFAALLGPGEIAVDQAGRFTATQLMRGPYEFRIRGAGMREIVQRESLERSPSHVVLRAEQPPHLATVAVRVTTTSGASVRAFSLSASQPRGKEMLGHQSLLADASGNARFRIVPGSYDFTIQAPRLAPVRRGPVEVADGGLLAFVIPDPSHLRLHFADANGKDVSDVTVAIEDEHGEPVAARVGPEGRALSSWSTGDASVTRASDLPASVPLVLTATSADGRRARLPVQLAPNEIKLLDVVLP
ncbi:MAG: zf-HC2 domain-containing protein [Planctomycetota bacterium]